MGTHCAPIDGDAGARRKTPAMRKIGGSVAMTDGSRRSPAPSARYAGERTALCGGAAGTA